MMDFEEWWKNESGWGGELLSEGHLAQDAWNAAVSSMTDERLTRLSDEERREIITDLRSERDFNKFHSENCLADAYEALAEIVEKAGE